MCGIAGILCPPGERPPPGLLEKMAKILGHRGPDAHGVHADDELGLAHARLSVIDLAGGAQPMHSADGRHSIVFNGEIFNYVELRDDLLARGRRFRTSSDTEVLLESYRSAGPDCVRGLNGQWAFAIWDRAARELFLSRDRPGVRPLFYTIAGGAFLFASEVKALFLHPAVSREIDPRGLDQTFTFWHPIGDRTIFRDIRVLPPGSSMRVRDGRVEVWSHWQPAYAVDGARRSAADWAEEIRALLVDATRLRLRADVPVGAYMSGGLDSSLITALIARFTATPLETFSVTFEEAEYDESRFQDEVVSHLGTVHHRVPCSRRDIAAVFPDVVWHAETPILRTAPAPMFLLSGLVRRHGFKVVLTGEGSDEIFGGYDIFKEAKIRRFWAADPDSPRRPRLLERLYPWMPSIQSLSPAYRQAFFRVRPADLASPFFSHLPRWETTARIKGLLAPDLRAALAGYDAREELLPALPAGFAGWHPFHQAQYLETAGLLPGYILSSQGDRMAMGHSVEGRFPFLDHRVMDLAARIPPRLKMKGLDEKHVLKEAAGDLVPAPVRARPKQPYRAPDARSFLPPPDAAEPPPDYVRDLLSPARLREYGIFAPEAVLKLVQKIGRASDIGVRDDMALVGVLSTQLVAHHFLHHFRGA
ncbi:MAG: asparagine synthase (glutamine-hydrolyzing) [Planctomycetota bacterium]